MTNLNRSPSQSLNYYHLLEIEQSASLKEIEKAYRRQALIHHPDRNPNHPQDQSTGNFQKIAQAYEILKDPTKRIKYDLKLSKSAMHRQASSGSNSNVHPTQPSKRGTKDSNQSPAFDLFGYPGETPQYVPALHLRSTSTTPSFRFRQNNSQPSEAIDPNQQNTPRSSNSNSTHRPFSVSPPSQHPESHHPLSQKIKLRDLDSLKLNIHLTSRPQARSNQSSNLHKAQTRAHPLNSPLSGVAPDPYLTFERAWGKNLDDIIDGIVDREIEQPRHFDRKSPTDPLLTFPKPRIVQRSSTVRSADSDYRPTVHDHSQSRPRSASGDRIGGGPHFPNLCGAHQGFPNRIPRETSSPIDDLKSYLPSPSPYLRSRRMSTGHENVLNSCPVHASQKLYRRMSNSGTCSSSSSSPFMHDGTSRKITATSQTVQSPQELPFFLNSNEKPINRNRASTTGLGKEFSEVIIRFERESDGSTRLSKELKSRTIALDGTVHDRYRRQRSAAVK